MVDEETGGLAHGVRSRLAGTSTDDDEIDRLFLRELPKCFRRPSPQHGPVKALIRNSTRDQHIVRRLEDSLSCFELRRFDLPATRGT